MRLLKASTSMSYSLAIHCSQTLFLYASVLESLASQLFRRTEHILHSSSSHLIFDTGSALLSTMFLSWSKLVLSPNEIYCKSLKIAFLLCTDSNSNPNKLLDIVYQALYNSYTDIHVLAYLDKDILYFCCNS